MTPERAIRFLHHEAARCRDHDDAEAFCLLLPAMLRILDLPPMNHSEAEAFKNEFRHELQENTSDLSAS
jgi:hypothetical protein